MDNKLVNRIEFDTLVERDLDKPSFHLIKGMRLFVSKPTFNNFISTGRFMSYETYKEMHPFSDCDSATQNIVKYGGNYIIEVVRGRKGDAYFMVNKKRYKTLGRAEKELWEKIIEPLVS